MRELCTLSWSGRLTGLLVRQMVISRSDNGQVPYGLPLLGMGAASVPALIAVAHGPTSDECEHDRGVWWQRTLDIVRDHLHVGDHLITLVDVEGRMRSKEADCNGHHGGGVIGSLDAGN